MHILPMGICREDVGVTSSNLDLDKLQTFTF